MKICIVLNSSWNVYNFRKGLVVSLISSGHDVTICTPNDGCVDQLVSLGCSFFEIPLNKNGKNIYSEIKYLFNLFLYFKKKKPDLILSFTIKPNIYGSIAARFCRIPIINNVAGLGAAFSKRDFFYFLIKYLYKISLCNSKCVFFQNSDDLNDFVNSSVVDSSVACLLPGSGVDLKHFTYNPVVKKEKFVFLLFSRMLWDKGILEYVEAAKHLKKFDLDVDFNLLGAVDAENPGSIPYATIMEWDKCGYINYLGSTNDVRQCIIDSDCVVLPSYYMEGTPKSLLETLAIGRPIITTNHPGCRDTVLLGKNGFLCEKKSVEDLIAKMKTVVYKSHSELVDMSLCSRKLAECRFDERFVVDKYLEKILL